MPKALLIHATDKSLDLAEQPSKAFPVLGLTTVASLFPGDWDIKLVDEELEAVDSSESADLVCISTLTLNAPHAYDLAHAFQNRGIPVLMGGMHPSALPEEALQHCDAVVVGEAEGVFHRVISDFEKGEMRGVYQGQLIDLATVPRPRVDLLRSKHLKILQSVQATRGCPNDCEFCSVTPFFGRKYRLRPIQNVISDIELQLSLAQSDIVFFVDDNIAGNPNYAKELFKALIPLNIRWGSFASVAMTKDAALMELAAKSGCIELFVGFESINQENLQSAGKNWVRVQKMQEYIKIFHEHGIIVEGAFIFGHDGDTKDIFPRTVDFIQSTGIQVPVFGLLTPYPATRLRKRLQEQNRLLPQSSNWRLYDGSQVLYQPMRMTAQELEEGFLWAKKFCAAPRSIFKRMLRAPKQNWWMALGLNFSMRKNRMRQINKRWPRKEKGRLSRPGNW